MQTFNFEKPLRDRRARTVRPLTGPFSAHPPAQPFDTSPSGVQRPERSKPQSGRHNHPGCVASCVVGTNIQAPNTHPGRVASCVAGADNQETNTHPGRMASCMACANNQ